jgi:hypothetical protein
MASAGPGPRKLRVLVWLGIKYLQAGDSRPNTNNLTARIFMFSANYPHNPVLQFLKQDLNILHCFKLFPQAIGSLSGMGGDWRLFSKKLA